MHYQVSMRGLLLWSTLLCLAPVAPRAQAATAAPHRLEGRITDMRGEPLAAAEVWLAEVHAPDQVVARATSDGDGVFLFAAVADSRPKWISAAHPGRAVTTLWVRAGGDPVQLRLHEAAPVTGVVVDRSGRPVANAPVRASLAQTRLPFGAGDETTTDAAGEFTLAKVPLGEVLFRALVPEQGVATLRTIVHGATAVQIAMAETPTTSLTIEVTALADAVPGDVFVDVWPAEGPLSLPRPYAHPRLGANQKVELTLLPDEPYCVQLRGAGLVLSPIELRVAAGKGPHHLTFTATRRPVPPAAEVPQAAAATTPADVAIEGRVLGTDGRPVRLVRARAMRRNPPSTMPEWSEVAAATTAADGSYSIRGLAPDQTALRVAVADERGTACSETLAEVRPGAPILVPDLRLTAAASIAGVVRNGNGKPRVGVSVWLREWDPELGAPRNGNLTEVLSDRDGRYRFLGVPSGAAWLEFGGQPTVFGLNRPFGPGALRQLAPMGNPQQGVGIPFAVEPGAALVIDL